MTDKNQVIITPHAIIGYIDQSTPCGRAKAKQVNADMETLATMLQDTHLSTATKKAIYTDYAKAIREYVERKETCCGCTNECDCECECEEEEEEYEEEEEEYEEPTIEDMENFTISVNGNVIECDSYEDTINKVILLEQTGFGYDVYAYDNEDNEYPCRVVDNGYDISLELDN